MNGFSRLPDCNKGPDSTWANEFRRRSIAALLAAATTGDKETRTTYEVLAEQWKGLAECHDRLSAARCTLAAPQFTH